MSGQGWRLARAGLTTVCAAALAIGFSACSSGGSDVFKRTGEIALSVIAEPEEVPQPQLTRAELNEIPYATIAVSSGSGSRAYLVPLADNGGYLDYRDAAGTSVRMLGGALAGFESAGHDLDGVLYDQSDPIAHPRPLDQWPAQIWREYQFSLRHLGPWDIALNCAFQPQGRETIEIVEVSFDVVRVNEICTNARRQVSNAYWIDEDTGFIWKSEQWLGPKIGQVLVEVIRPYAG
jgi:hypothetical protein